MLSACTSVIEESKSIRPYSIVLERSKKKTLPTPRKNDETAPPELGMLVF
jgi:hypothetical protein